MQVRNSGFNIAYAINVAFAGSLFRYFVAADWLRDVNVRKMMEGGICAPTTMPVVKMALGFLTSPEQRKWVCSDAIAWLRRLVEKTEAGIETLRAVFGPIRI